MIILLIQHFTYVSVDGCLGCFHFWAINAADIHVRVFCIDVAFNSLGYIPKNGIGGSYGNSIFNFLRSCQIVFYSN